MVNFNKLSKAFLALLVLAAMPFGDLLAQNFIMQTGAATYNATCGGVIKMKSVSGAFVNNGGNVLGTVAAANAIDGIVDWAATSATQTVQGLWYEKMVITGGVNKTIQNGVYITGVACATPTNGYDFTVYSFYIDNPAGGVNDFQGTFNYVGANQNVFPVTGDDSYNNLAMNGPGTYTMPDGTITTVDGTISLPTGNTLAVLGDLNTGATSTLAGVVGVNNGGSINIGTGDITFNGNVTVTDGSLNGGTGDITIGATSTLALVGTTSVVDLGPAEEMFVTGSFTNGGDGTNLDFACTSVITYNGTANPQTVVPTINSNPYGILNLSAGNKRGGLGNGNNIEICGNFSLAGGNLDMLTSSGYVNMLNETSTATYTLLSEVEGQFRRQFTTAAAGPYTFNNSGTELTFTNAPDAAGFYQLFVEGGAPPETYVSGTDVNRKITPDYSVGLGSIAYTLKVAYLQSELPSPFTTPLGETDLKFFEADGTPASEKVAGTGYGRVPAGAGVFGTLSLGGMINGVGSIDGIIEREFIAGNDLVLRANNTMYSIVDGRWSNPNVWDEGRIPVSTDNVEIRTMVYVGIDGPFAGTAGGTDGVATDNRRAEFADYGSGNAANMITIGLYTNASLIVGNEDNGATYVHKTAFNGTSFINNNTVTTVNGGLFGLAKAAVVKADVNGLWMTEFVTGTATGVPTLGTTQIQNSGAINNQGVIEVGN